MALFGGPAYLLVAAMASWHMEGWALFTAVAAFIGGFVALVVRMGDGPPNDSGWDDGAVLWGLRPLRAYDFDVVVLGANDSTTSV
ncbi:hypothetical protein ACFQ0B_64230 [Nonomuraea thailandensis]